MALIIGVGNPVTTARLQGWDGSNWVNALAETDDGDLTTGQKTLKVLSQNYDYIRGSWRRVEKLSINTLNISSTGEVFTHSDSNRIYRIIISLEFGNVLSGTFSFRVWVWENVNYKKQVAQIEIKSGEIICLDLPGVTNVSIEVLNLGGYTSVPANVIVFKGVSQ